MQTAETPIRVELAISADEYLKMYRGTAKQVVATASDGRVVRFPANCLQPFVTHSGIYGRFELFVDPQHKLLRIQRCPP
ncbi:MAG: DUF2835 domain-containing protein [Gammaproteobacteria bacterium]|nr:DUF2835 domain-containing protein [Gammaproteobacteria bacterium]